MIRRLSPADGRPIDSMSPLKLVWHFGVQTQTCLCRCTFMLCFILPYSSVFQVKVANLIKVLALLKPGMFGMCKIRALPTLVSN